MRGSGSRLDLLAAERFHQLATSHILGQLQRYLSGPVGEKVGGRIQVYKSSTASAETIWIRYSLTYTSPLGSPSLFVWGKRKAYTNLLCYCHGARLGCLRFGSYDNYVLGTHCPHVSIIITL